METPGSPIPGHVEESCGEHELRDEEKHLDNGHTIKPRSPRRKPGHRAHNQRARPGKQRSTVALICVWIVHHQLAIAANLLCLLLMLHIAFPAARNYTRKFTHLSYYNEERERYALGRDDFFFVCFWIVLLTGLRAGVLDHILIPLAAWAGIKKQKAKVRFAEQAWLLCHHGTTWSCGMYIWYNSPYWLNLRALWSDFPTRDVDGLVKYYYLVASAFWLQQLVVVNIEERRKDHWQMFTHHLITCALMFGSYCYHSTKVGNVVLCLMDVVDLFLPMAKILKYLKFRRICDVAFGAFMIIWFVARHLFYLQVCWSIYAHLPEEMTYGCYRGPASNLQGPLPIPDDYDHLIQPFLDPTGLVCVDDGIRRGFLEFLLALQCILLIWLTMIVKVAYKVISGEGADDTRSDDENSEAEEEAEDAIDMIRLCAEPRPYVPLTNLPIEKEVGFDEMRISPSRRGRVSPVRRSLRKSDGSHAAASTGVSLRGPSNPKELLGRIGCDKGS